MTENGEGKVIQNVPEDDKNRVKNKGFAVTALVIGLLMILFNLFLWFAALYFIAAGSYIEGGMETVSRINIVIDSLGLLSGIIGLKSNSRNIAIMGIVLCSISFFLLVVMIVKGPGLLGLPRFLS
jgi:hypothetical protein